jgi:hypothetical protein
LNKGGRPKKKIDYETVEKLASIMCTQEEISSFLDISVRTLQRDTEFCRIYKKGLNKGKMSLRRKQFNMSDTNPTMAIWLGKQYLDQKDKQDIEHTGEIKTIINVIPAKGNKDD